ncbi:MAG: ABC transporter substrate-binding protein, partial [Candidatus Alkanophagales archaeon]
MRSLVAKNNTASHGLRCVGAGQRRRSTAAAAKTLALSLVAFVVLVAATLAAPTAAVTGAAGKSESKYPITVVDSAGNTIVIEKPVERVVALTSDAAEVIRAIGAADKVVGVSKYVVQDEAFFPELSRLPSVGSCFSPDIEKIIELEPDIVITYVKWPTPDKLDEHLEGT